MAKVYLVDSENIGSGWSQLLASMTEADRMYVFYTDKSPYISYENLLQVIAYCNIPVFLKCYEGKNALDFQLVSELGFKLCEAPSAEFIIVSDDYGYDAAVKYWSERKYNVCRIGKKLCRPALPKRREHNGQTEVVAVQAEEPVRDAVVQEAPKVVLPAAETAEAPEVSQKEAVQPVVIGSAVTEAAEVSADIEAVKAADPVEVEQESLAAVTDEAASAADVQKAEATDAEAAADTAADTAAETMADEKAVVENVAVEDTAENAAEATIAEDAPKVEQTPQKDGQSSRRARERRKRNRKEAVKENDKALEADKSVTDKAAKEMPEAAVEVSETVSEAAVQDEGYQLDLLLVDIARRSGSAEPEKDARCVKELFYTIKMSDLTNLNNALKILIGNEMGNDIYRELKEHSEYRTQLDALYCPVLKNRFIHYVQIVLDRSELKDVTADNIGNFLLNIPRKNLNSIRSSILKEYGQENGAEIYTVLKAHIKVLNKI